MKWRWLVLSWLALAFAGCSDPSDPILGAASAAKDRDQGAYLHHFTPRSRDLLELLWSGSDAHWTNLDVGRIQVLETGSMSPSSKGAQRSYVVFSEHEQVHTAVVHSSGGVWLIDLVDSEGALTRLGAGI